MPDLHFNGHGPASNKGYEHLWPDLIKAGDEKNAQRLNKAHNFDRYPDEEMLAEATKTFPNSGVAADFDRIVI